MGWTSMRSGWNTSLNLTKINCHPTKFKQCIQYINSWWDCSWGPWCFSSKGGNINALSPKFVWFLCLVCMDYKKQHVESVSVVVSYVHLSFFVLNMFFCLNSTHIDSASGLSQNNTPDIRVCFSQCQEFHSSHRGKHVLKTIATSPCGRVDRGCT